MARMQFSRQIQTRALSSVYGKIEQLLLAYPGGMADVRKGMVTERYGPIFKAFPDRVTFVILGHFGEKSNLVENVRSAFSEALLANQIDPEHHLVFRHTPFAGSLCMKTHDVHSEYAQDPFVIMESDIGQTVLLEPIRQNNPENANLAEQLAAYAGYMIQPSLVAIDGGNLLIGDDYALVGRNVLEDNILLAKMMSPQEPQKWIEMYLKKTLGVRYIIWVGTASKMNFGTFHSTGSSHFQPFFHLDLFMTLLGRTSIGTECVLLAKIDIAEVDGAKPKDVTLLKRINDALDSVENDLEKYGTDRVGPIFEIHRNEIGGKVMPTRNGSCFVPFAYNNAQVEQFQNIKRIYIPSFDSMSSLESKFKGQLLRLGFEEPRAIRNNFEDYAENGGSLHCLSSVLARAPF